MQVKRKSNDHFAEVNKIVKGDAMDKKGESIEYAIQKDLSNFSFID